MVAFLWGFVTGVLAIIIFLFIWWSKLEEDRKKKGRGLGL
jgi:hypothetical protein